MDFCVNMILSSNIGSYVLSFYVKYLFCIRPDKGRVFFAVANLRKTGNKTIKTNTISL